MRRGDFERRYLLTGEIDAVSRADLKVPRIPAGKATLRWLESDGAQVKKGDKLAELDNATYVTALKERTLTASQAEIELKRQQWENQLVESDRMLEVERKRAAVKRAEIDADLPPGILPKRDYLEKQLALRRARADLERAEEALATQRRTAALDLQLRRISLEKALREVKAAEAAIEDLTLRAPIDGAVIVGDHYEGRKLQISDDVFVGTTVVRMPDLRQIRVKAWLSDVDDGRVAVGMPAEIVLDAFPDRVLRGQVLEIAPVAREPSERSFRRVFQVSVTIDGAEDPDLRPGMSARVEVIAERKSDVVLVPRAAVEARSEGAMLRLADGRHAAVTLGACGPVECVATGGAAPGTALRKAAP